MKFKKITAIATSVLMTGLTVASAAAAAFPAPFVDNGKADVAIVYGADADMVAANNVHTALGKFVTSTGATTVTGGEVFALDKSSTHMNFNDSLNSVYSSLDEDEMPKFLADGTYDDGKIEEDYSQKIILGENVLTLFSDKDYKNEAISTGFQFVKGDKVLSYTIDFDDDDLKFSDMEDTEMPLMGNSYYVLNADNKSIEVLDSAEKTVLAEGETVTVDGHTVSIEYISGSDVKFMVDGELTDKLADHDSYELKDGSYIVLNENLYSSKEGAVSKAEISLGKGKMTLTDGEEVEINGEDVDGLMVDFDFTENVLKGLTLTWNADEDLFLTESSSLIMPGFETIKVLSSGLQFPAESEKISVSEDETISFDLGMDEDFEVMTYKKDGAINVLGSDDNALIPSADGTYTDLKEDDRIVITKLDKELSEVKTSYYQVKSIKIDETNDYKIELEDLNGENDLVFEDKATDEANDMKFTVSGLVKDVAKFNLTVAKDGSYANELSYNKVFTKTGLMLTLPTTNATDSKIKFTEANADGDLIANDAVSFDATIKMNDDKLHLSLDSTNVADKKDQDNTDKHVAYVKSDLSTKIAYDTDSYDFEIEYFGKEVTADVSIASADAVVTNAAAADFLPVKASDIDSVKSKNLVIVGGSCINAAAATALGGAYCGEAFTEATGVTAGQFLIKEVKDAFTAGKFALVVAGYEAADTKNAVTYLTTTKDVDTSVAIVKGLESTTNLA